MYARNPNINNTSGGAPGPAGGGAGFDASGLANMSAEDYLGNSIPSPYLVNV
jgi:hypothetical protein